MSCKICRGYTQNLFPFNGLDLVMCTQCGLIQLRASKELPLKDFLEHTTDQKIAFKVPYIGEIIATDTFSAITPKETAYYSLKSLDYLLGKYNFQILDARVKGTSINVWATRIDSLFKLRIDEELMKLDKWGTYFLFSLRYNKAKDTK